jgi:hypothetical protein
LGENTKGDFTRDTFHPDKHFVRVLLQQGRVQLDADWNEENSIILHYLQTLTKDLIGTHGGPSKNCGFEIVPLWSKEPSSLDFAICCGHYYVDGILCEAETPTTTIVRVERSTKKPETRRNAKHVWTKSDEKVEKLKKDKIEYRQVTTYNEQPDYPLPESEKLRNTTFPCLVYLDVWERHITYIEDDSIREVALGGPDTTTRSKTIWQVKTRTLKDNFARPAECYNTEMQALLYNNLQTNNRGRLKARVAQQQYANAPESCVAEARASYLGTENQLYRVEIHRGNEQEGPTFKWSRENGSVAFPISRIEGSMVTLSTLGRDSRLSLEVGDFVEIEDDDYVLQNRAGRLLEIVEINRTNIKVLLDEKPSSTVGTDTRKHPLLRRWDHRKGDPKAGGLTLSDGAAIVRETEWLKLENGIEILFEGEDQTYCTGDYWLIPARAVTQDIEWPRTSGSPDALSPHGVPHHYAPLAIISIGGKALRVKDCRRKFRMQIS